MLDEVEGDGELNTCVGIFTTEEAVLFRRRPSGPIFDRASLRLFGVFIRRPSGPIAIQLTLCLGIDMLRKN